MSRRLGSRLTRSRRVRSCGKVEVGTAAGRPTLKESRSSSVRRCRSGDSEPLRRSRAWWRMSARARQASSPAHVLQSMADRVTRTSDPLRALSLLVLLIVAGACNLEATPKPTEPKNLTGVLGAASYEIDVPAVWNGTLFLYSHGYVAPGSGNPALSAPPEGRAWLLDHHFAAAGSAYASTGWAVEEAFRDQIALLDLFDQKIGKPKRVIAWGHSMGGLISAGIRPPRPRRLSTEMPVRRALAGGIAKWEAGPDPPLPVKELPAPPSALELLLIP